MPFLPLPLLSSPSLCLSSSSGTRRTERAPPTRRPNPPPLPRHFQITAAQTCLACPATSSTSPCPAPWQVGPCARGGSGGIGIQSRIRPWLSPPPAADRAADLRAPGRATAARWGSPLRAAASSRPPGSLTSRRRSRRGPVDSALSLVAAGVARRSRGAREWGRQIRRAAAWRREGAGGGGVRDVGAGAWGSVWSGGVPQVQDGL